MKEKSLSDEEKAIYEWQMWVPGHGETGQQRLKGSSVLVSRLGGLGGLVAYELAAAGVGKLVLAHGGTIKPSDLNRQLLMTHAGLGSSRIASVEKRLKELNPRLEVLPVAENVSQENVDSLVSQVDLVVDCAPLFEERLLMNQAAVQKRIPLVECAMYDMELNVTTIIPGQTPCLGCLYPKKPKNWKRQFPVFGAVSGTAACIGAVEAIKMLSGFGQTLQGELLQADLRSMKFRKLRIRRDPNCRVCSAVRS